MLPGVVLDGLRRAAVGIAFAKDRVQGAALDPVVARPGVLLGVRLRIGREIRDLVALGLELGDGLNKLGHRSTDVGQLDDIGLGLEGESAQFC